MEEEWRIVDIAPTYAISNFGRVQKIDTGRILSSHISTGGYPTVNISNEGRFFQKAVHILVANAFVEGRQPNLVVNHIDGNKTNFSPENLEWITQQENMAHAKRIGKIRKMRKWEYDPVTGKTKEI